LGGDQDAGQAVLRGGDYASLAGTGGGEDTETVLFQLAGDAAHPLAGHAVGLDVAMDDEYRKLQVLVHAPASPDAQAPPADALRLAAPAPRRNPRQCRVGASPSAG